MRSFTTSCDGFGSSVAIPALAGQLEPRARGACGLMGALVVVAGICSSAQADITVESSVAPKKVDGVVVGKTIEYCIKASEDSDRIASFHITLPDNAAKHSNPKSADTGWGYEASDTEISWSTTDNLNRNFPGKREKCFTIDILYADNGGATNYGQRDMADGANATWDKVDGSNRDQFFFEANVNTADFLTVPSPGSLALCGLGMLAAGRRRPRG